MKRKLLTLTLLSSALLIGTTLSSCGDNNPNDDNTVSDDDNKGEDNTAVTGVVIGGPLSVKMGETIKLSVDVLGSDDDSVTWKSLNEDIATVDASGVVTGVKVGDATIEATSLLDPNYSATYKIKVTGEMAKEIFVVIEESDDIIVDENGVYNIPGGKTFKVSYRLGNTNAIVPDSIAYSFSYSNGSNTSVEDCVIENQGDGTALVTFNKVFTGGVISVSASYATSVEGSIKNAVSVNSYDKNAENVTKLNSIISSIKGQELASLTKAKHTYKTSSVTEVSEFNLFNDSTYTKVTRKDNESETVTNRYSVIDKEESAFYFFSYDESKKISEMYSNNTFIDRPALQYEYEEYAKLPNFIISDLPVYGFSSLFTSIASGASYRGSTAFGDFSTRGNATYTFTDTSAKVVTEYENSAGNIVSIDFELNYNANYQLTGFNYVYQLGATKDTLETVFEESGSDFVYATKGEDNIGTINIDDYYIKDFDIEYVDNYEEIAIGPGADGTRYDVDKEEEQEDGTTLYTLPYNHSLPLRIHNFTPATGSALFDVANVTVSNEVTGTRSIMIYRDGIAVINAPQKDDGTYVATKETVTFETRGGGTGKVQIQWNAPELGGIEFDCPKNQETNTTNVFRSVRVYDETDYFWLQTDTEDTSYEFGMEVTSGPSDGIKLKAHDGDTDKLVPTGAYTIETFTPGTYNFYFYIVGHEDEFRTATFTLVVQEPISAEEYKENLIGKTYEYNLSMGVVSLTFTSDSIMTMTMPTTSDDREEGDNPDEAGEATVNIRYQITDGRVTVLTDQGKVNQIFNSTNSYFESIYGGDIEISDDYRSVNLMLRTRSDAAQDQVLNYNYNQITFALKADTSTIVGNKYAGSSFLSGASGYGMSTLTIFFEDQKSGSFEIVSNSTQQVAAKFSFDYTIDLESNEVEMTNVVLKSAQVTGITFKSARMGSNNMLNITVSIPNEYGSLDTTFGVDLTLPL